MIAHIVIMPHCLLYLNCNTGLQVDIYLNWTLDLNVKFLISTFVLIVMGVCDLEMMLQVTSHESGTDLVAH